MPTDFLQNRDASPQTVTIAAAASLSEAVDLRGMMLLAIFMPAAWDAAVLTFMGSPTLGGTYLPIYDDASNEVTVPVAAGKAVAIDAALLKLAPFRYIKIRSGTAATPVAQTAERKITVAGKG